MLTNKEFKYYAKMAAENFCDEPPYGTTYADFANGAISCARALLQSVMC